MKKKQIDYKMSNEVWGSGCRVTISRRTNVNHAVLEVKNYHREDEKEEYCPEVVCLDRDSLIVLKDTISVLLVGMKK